MIMNEMEKQLKEQRKEYDTIKQDLKDIRIIFTENNKALEGFHQVFQQSENVLREINRLLEEITVRLKVIEEKVKTNESQKTRNNSNVVELDRETHQSEE